jgi:hypothetical protein
MAAPVDSARQGTNISTAGTSHAINVGSPVAGTLLIVLVRFAAAPGTVTFTGYTQLASDTSDATDDQTMIFARTADGTEGATDTLTTTNSVKAAAICWEITGAETVTNSPPTLSTVAVGTTAANGADPGSAVPVEAPQDTLYLALMGLDGEGNAPTVAPSSYSNLQTANSGTASTPGTNCSVGGASRELTASSSEDPGNFTHAAATTGWTAYTVAIRAATARFASDAARAVTDTGGSNTTTPSFNVPAGVMPGQLLVLAWRAGGNVISITNAAGFTQLVLSSADGTDDDFYVGYKIADGTEGASVQFTVSNGRRFAGVMWLIADGGTPTISSVGTGSGTTINPATYTPASARDYLWIALGCCEDARTVSAAPTNYDNLAFENVSSGVDGATCCGATRRVGAAAVNPEPGFTITVTSNAHMHAVVAIPYELDSASPPGQAPAIWLPPEGPRTQRRWA